ncbi:MAG: (2Fe-2S) ferredoxin domain-containing protein [Bacilli bacterium]|nr:(2Fe-2S) ferredoxin domain-containing protein [Bacilli bacterium]
MKKTIADLEKIRMEALKNIELRNSKEDVRIVVGMGTCGISAGAREVLNALVDEISRRELKNIKVVPTGCVGMCRLEPMFDVYKDGEKVTYVDMTPEKARQVVVEHLVNNRIIEDYTIGKRAEE